MIINDEFSQMWNELWPIWRYYSGIYVEWL